MYAFPNGLHASVFLIGLLNSMRFSGQTERATRPLTWTLILAIAIIAANLLGYADYPFTLGMLLGSLYGIALFRLIVVTGILKGLSAWYTHDDPVSCQILEIVQPVLLPADGWFEYIVRLVGFAWEVVLAVLQNPRLIGLVLNHLASDSWLDSNWQGTINISSFVITTLALMSCGAP